MSDRIRAKVIRVRVDKRGATLASTAAVGATQLLVKDAGDLAGDSVEHGKLLVDDDSAAVLDFTDVTFVEDTDPGDLTTPDTVTLAAPLTTAIVAGTGLFVYETPDDASDDGVVAEVIARCTPDDDEDAAESGEPIRAIVPPEFQDDLPPGRRDASVVLEYDDDADEWSVVRLRGRNKGLKFEHAEPPYAPTDAEMAAGTFTRQLLHRNIAAKSGLFTTVNGVALDSQWWSLDAAAGRVTVTIPTWMSGLAAADRVFDWPMYAYRSGIAVNPVEVTPPPAPAPVNFTVVGSLGDHNQPSTSSTAFPAGTTTGDLFIYACISRNGYVNQCPDSRATLWVNSTLGIYETAKVWVGTVTSPGTPLSINNTGSSGNFETSWRLMVIRPASTVTFDASKISDSGVQPTGGVGSIPGLSGVSGAIGVGFSAKATSATIHSWPSPWTGSASTTGTYIMVSLAAQVNTTVGSTPALTPDTWRGFALGVGLG